MFCSNWQQQRETPCRTSGFVFVLWRPTRKRPDNVMTSGLSLPTSLIVSNYTGLNLNIGNIQENCGSNRSGLNWYLLDFFIIIYVQCTRIYCFSNYYRIILLFSSTLNYIWTIQSVVVLFVHRQYIIHETCAKLS